MEGRTGAGATNRVVAEMVEGSPEIVGQENTNGDQTKAQTAMENILQRAPGINALYTINEPAAAGAYQAIQSAGRADQITIGSIDTTMPGFNSVSISSRSSTPASRP